MTFFCFTKKIKPLFFQKYFLWLFLLLVSGSATAELLFFDDFEYVVDKNKSSDPSGVNNPFVTRGGWTRVKAVNITGSHLGYIHTVTQIPGYSGKLPGKKSSHVLALEMPETQPSQSDFYLQYGEGEKVSYENKIPANVWFQFWHYTNHYGSQRSQLERRHKFIYPCAGAYPCKTNKWLLSLSSMTYNPLNKQPYGERTLQGEGFLISRDHNVGTINYFGQPDPAEAGKLGQSTLEEYLVPNRWNLVKIHFDTSDVKSGKFEAWIRPHNGKWVKVVEWIGGVTPNFTWTLPTAGGHRVFRMPTTIGWPKGKGNGPVWYYMDDFAMANTEEALPVYDDMPVVPIK